MGEYIQLAQHYANKLKPLVERKVRKTGIELEDIIIEDALSDVSSDHEADLSEGTSMYVRPFIPNRIYAYEQSLEKKKHPESFIPMAIIHELSHIVQDNLIKKRRWDLSQTSPRYARWFWNRYDKIHSFNEGFAEYMSLNYLADMYTDVLEKVKQEELEPRKANLSSYKKDFTHNLSANSIYRARGYKFFKNVISALGEEKLMEVASKPALHEIEIRIPLLYLMRNYPMKGIKNIPKLMYQSIKRRIKK